jgi:hypothetical protein
MMKLKETKFVLLSDNENMRVGEIIIKYKHEN